LRQNVPTVSERKIIDTEIRREKYYSNKELKSSKPKAEKPTEEEKKTILKKYGKESLEESINKNKSKSQKPNENDWKTKVKTKKEVQKPKAKVGIQ
jgi:hypothetical protein